MSPEQSTGEPGVSPGQEERRAFRRVELRAPAMLDAASSYHSGQCENVSAGGVVVHTDAGLEVGTQVELYFELPNGIAVEANAEVVRRDGSHIALKFVELEHELVVALRAFCRRSGMMAAVRPSRPDV